MASNPGRIPAGGRDKISVEVSTRNKGGSTLRKGFTVYTNDPALAQIKLTVAGQVKGHIAMSPTRIQFMGRQGQALSRTVSIKPLNNHAFNIKEVKAQKGEHLTFDLKPAGGDAAQNGYELEVRNTMQAAGTYRDLITITTDSAQKPILRIPVTARIIQSATSPGPTANQ